MNPNSQTLTHARKNEESIDRNLFIEAITLCAIYQEKDQVLQSALAFYDPSLNQEPSPELLRLLLTYALDLVEAMNMADGIFKQPLQ